MKGYNTSNGYMGYVEGKYILFASEVNKNISSLWKIKKGEGA